MDESGIVSAVRAAFVASDVKRKFRGPLVSSGQCYIAAEAVFHLMGGRRSGLQPMFQRVNGIPHWWVKGPYGEVIDPTADQFGVPVDYKSARKATFLTGVPSKRAARLIARASELMVIDRVVGEQ